MALNIADFGKQTVEQIIGYGTGSLIGSALEPIALAQKNEVFKRVQSARIDPSDAAVAVIENAMTLDQGRAEAAEQGLTPERFQALYDIATTGPDLGAALDLWRRGALDDNAFASALRKMHLNPGFVAAMRELKRVLVAPSDLAMARQQGFISDDDGRVRSEAQGVDATDADLLYEMSGLPPGIETALTMLRRGIIDESRFAQIVREGHTKTKYTAELLHLLDNVPSIAAAVEGVVRERIPHAEGAKIAALNGYTEKDFNLLYEIAGRPISVTEALTLYNRKEYTAEQVRAVVARSNVRPEFTDDILKLAVRYPPLFQISRLLAAGSIDDAYALQILEFEGIPAKLAQGIVHAGHKTKTAKTKDLSLSVIETLYDAGLETSDHALKLIEEIGYTPEEAKSLLNVHDARRYAAEMSRAAMVVRNKYVNHLIDRGTALADLDQLTGDPSARKRLLSLWDLERAANVRALTPSEVGQAVKYNIIGDDEAIGRWVNLGYSTADAEIKLQIVHKGPAHPATGTVP